jgi:hypothetical protein
MKKFALLFLALQVSCLSHLSGQVMANNPGMALEALFGRLASAQGDSLKIQINDSINNIVESYVGSDSIFSHRFTNIRYLGQIQSSDSKLKIVTWNLPLRNSPGRYYCYFINNTGKGNAVYRLMANYREAPMRSDTLYSESDWYGALYYDIRPFKQANKQYWLVLGVDYGNPSVTRKLIDVVGFGTDGRLNFGKKIFAGNNGLSYRVVLEYSSDAVISLKFINEKTIAFDHLVPISAEFRENREKYGPEFSYDGYVLDKGIWRFKENIDIRNRR